jgi:hypothetical protein
MADQDPPQREFAEPQPIGRPGAAGAGHSVRLGKTRGPLAVWLLALITVGIYGWVWYYKINRELRDYNGQIMVSPGVALCNVTIIGAVTAGIAAIVSFCFTGNRIDRATRFAGAGSCSPVAGILLQVFVFGTGVCYYQSRLNRVWAAHGQG